MISAEARATDAKLIDLHPDSLLCPPDWRWRLALRLSKETKPNKLASHLMERDAFLRSVVSFLKKSNKDMSEDGQYETLMTWPNLTQAHNLHFHPLTHIAPAIQAWVISGESSVNIARKYGASPNVIGWYERVFYDVRDRLDHHDYVVHVLLGDKHHNGMNERDFGLFWKFMAFTGGPITLDAIMTKSHSLIKPTKAEDLPQFIKDATKNSVNLKALIAARTITLSPLTTIPLIELWHNLAKADSASGADTGVSSVLKIVGEVLTGLPHAAGRTAIDYSESTMPKIGGKSVNLLAADLRADELSSLASTGKIPEGLETIQYPLAPRGKKDEHNLFDERKDAE